MTAAANPGGHDAPPIPDPTTLTTEQLVRAVSAERDYVNGQLDVLRERLRGIDRATELLSASMTLVPTDVDKQVGHLKELMQVELESIANQFRERDTRSEREARDNKVAVDAAFAAQKEAAAKQDESNAKAIDKSEKATTETIGKLAELFRTTTDAIIDKIDDDRKNISELRQAINGAARAQAGGSEQRTEHRNQAIDSRAVLASVIGVVLFILTIAGFVITQVANNKP